MTTQRQQVLEILVEFLQEIRVGNGYETDAGQQVFLGIVPLLGEGDPDYAIAVLPDEDALTSSRERIAAQWPISIAIVRKVVGGAAASVTAWQQVEAILGDVKRAIETRLAGDKDHRIDGSNSPKLSRGTTQLLERESGSPIFGLAIRYVVDPMVEDWGNP